MFFSKFKPILHASKLLKSQKKAYNFSKIKDFLSQNKENVDLNQHTNLKVEDNINLMYNDNQTQTNLSEIKEAQQSLQEYLEEELNFPYKLHGCTAESTSKVSAF